ncbi:MAG: lamin tail domain-containing protein [Bacteroidota bacterium]
MNSWAQVFISELYTATNGNAVLGDEKYVEIYNPLSCPISLNGWELEVISNCTQIISYDLSSFTINAGQAMRFSGSGATLASDGTIAGFNSSNVIYTEWNGQSRDGARLRNATGAVEDLALPNNLMNCGTVSDFYIDDRLVRQDDVCQGSPSFSAAEWLIIPVSTIADLPISAAHFITCSPGASGISGLWTGAQSNDWHDCRNWDDLNIPNAGTDVVIPHDALTFCELTSANGACNNLSITGSGLGDISLQIRNGFELDVNGQMYIERTNGDGFCALIMDEGTLDISGNLNITLNSPVITSSIFIDFSTNQSNLLSCANINSVNSSAVFNTIDFNMGSSSGNIDCQNFEITGSGIFGSNDFTADFGLTSSSTLEIAGNMTLNNFARVDFKAGNFNIAGNLTDNNLSNSGILFGQTGPTRSTFQFKGSTDQSINSAHLIRLYNMSLLNTLGSSVILNTSVEINNVLNLGNDYIQLNENTLFIEESDPSAIIGTGGIVCESQTFTGRIDWLIEDNGDTYTFPFAATVGGTVIDFIFDMTNGETDRVEVSTYGTAADNLPFPPGVSSLDNATSPGFPASIVDRWWLIEAPDEDALSADITFTYLDSEEHSMGCVACTNAKRHTGTMWEPGFIDNTPSYNDIPLVLHQVTIENVSVFSPWGISTINEPLPIELVEFEASKLNKNKTLLNWQTLSELNSAHFEIERSRDGIHFTKIGKELAAGLSNVPIYYSFIDTEPYNGQNYYRLKSLDFDGSFDYSAMRSVFFEDCGQLLRDLDGYVLICSESMPYELFNAQGKLIENGVKSTIRFGQLSPGIYLLRTPREVYKLIY